MITAVADAEKKKLSPAAIDLFLDYSWPGNIRELKNTVQYACAVAVGNEINIDDLPLNMQQSIKEEAPAENILEDMERKLILKTPAEKRL